jgi:DNA repair exonuclease SbcCD ATPase subunit
MTTPSPDQKARLKRYSIFCGEPYDAVESSDGQFYRVADVDGKLDEVRAEIESLKKQVAELDQRNDRLAAECNTRLKAQREAERLAVESQNEARKSLDALDECFAAFTTIIPALKPERFWLKAAASLTDTIAECDGLRQSLAALQSQALAEGLEAIGFTRILFLRESFTDKIDGEWIRPCNDIGANAATYLESVGILERHAEKPWYRFRAEAEKARKEKG